MKHQLFRKNRYVQIDLEREDITVLGRIKDSTIITVPVINSTIFKKPIEMVELRPELFLLSENPEIAPVLTDSIHIDLLLEEFKNFKLEEDKMYVSIKSLSLPGKELKEMYYDYTIKGAKHQ